jgi:hypothetical protein
MSVDRECGMPNLIAHIGWALVGAMLLLAWLLWPDARTRYRWRR